MMFKAKWICIALLILTISSVAYSADALEKKAQKAKDAGNYQEAADCYTKMIEQNKNVTSAHFERAMIYVYLEDPENAVQDLDYVIEKRPDFADAWNLRGLLYSSKPDIEQAIADYTKAIQLDPQFGAAYINRGTAYIEKELDDEALADFNLAQKIWKDNPEIYYNRGNIYKKRKEYSQAIQDYTQTIALGGDNEEIRYKRANCYFQVGKFEEALIDYNNILKNDPNNINYLNNRAVTLDQLGRTMEADVDRSNIKKIQAKAFPPVETIEYVTHYAEDGTYLLKLPKGWAFTKQDAMYLITDQPMDAVTQPRVMGQVYYALNFALGKEFTTPQETIMWWEDFITKSGDNYEHYFFRSRKDKPYKGEYPSKYNISEAQIVKDGPSFRHFDYAIAYGTHLFHLNIQVSEDEQEYYDTIIDEIVRSVALLNPPN